MSTLPIQTIIAFRGFHRRARSFRAAGRAEPATESLLDHRMWEQILQATTMWRIRGTIACRSLALRAPLRLQMPVLIKLLSVAAQLRQSRLTGLRRQQAPGVSTRTR